MSKQQQEAVRSLRTVEEWLALGEEAKKHGLLYLLLTGGEPFSRPDFREILSGLHKMGFVISINSNSTMIDEQVVEWLKETPPTRINITLYGASDATYERLCRNPKGFTQATSYMFPPLRRDASKVGQNDRFTYEDAAYYSAKIESLLNGEDDYLERMKTKNLSLPADPGEDCMDAEILKARNLL